MKLIPEQISYLRTRQAELKNSIASYKDYLTSRDITSSDHSARALIGDSVIDNQYQSDLNSYNEVTELLTKSEYIKKRDTETIQIGTKFIVEYPNMQSTNAIILADAVTTLMGRGGFTSCSSPLGRAVMGKKEGDTIQFTLPGSIAVGNRVVGTIKEIKKDPNDYLHFINEKEFNYRISKAERRYRREHPEKTEKVPDITESQRYLLILEKERLERQVKDTHTIGRLGRVNMLLATANVATPPTDRTIGIGSTFDVVVTDNETSQTMHYEMVNRAVSDELEDAYVEKIGVLGSKLFGLRQNDKISYRKNGKSYNVVVLNVDIPVKESVAQYRK